MNNRNFVTSGLLFKTGSKWKYKKNDVRQNFESGTMRRERKIHV